jgi:hypothetical protein
MATSSVATLNHDAPDSRIPPRVTVFADWYNGDFLAVAQSGAMLGAATGSGVAVLPRQGYSLFIGFGQAIVNA